jgi:iron(III) transport system substrate-binding protein
MEIDMTLFNRVRTWRALPLVVLLMAFATLLAACGGDDPTATATTAPAPQSTATEAMSSDETAWEELVAAAKAEGRIDMFACCNVSGQIAEINDAFTAKYGIEVVASGGSPSKGVTRILSEREAGQKTLDLWINGPVSGSRLINGNALTSIKDMLILPEVRDTTDLLTGEWLYSDTANRELLIAFAVNARTADFVYNTNNLDPSEIMSYYDILDPKYKGKILINDPRQGQGGTPLAFMFTNPQIGKDWLTRLFTEMDVVVSSDLRQAAELLSRGDDFAVCLFGCSTEVELLKEQGLPVEDIFPTVPKEGTWGSASPYFIGALEGAPHPAATQLYINWYLSIEGQTLVQNLVKMDSVRTDIPKDAVLAGNRRQEGVDYFLFQFSASYNDDLAEAQEFVKELIANMGG